MSQEKIKVLLDKINLLVNVFMKDGMDKVSTLEKDLLSEQVHELLRAVQSLSIKETGSQQLNPSIVVKESASAEQVEVDDKKAALSEKVQLDSSEKNMESSKDFSANKPQRSIKELIDLNKSFILKAELFANDHSAYSSFIQSLEEQESEKASFELLGTKQHEMSWDSEDKAYQLLVRAIEKRFLPFLHQ